MGFMIAGSSTECRSLEPETAYSDAARSDVVEREEKQQREAWPVEDRVCPFGKAAVGRATSISSSDSADHLVA